jgi:hypothetical protein
MANLQATTVAGDLTGTSYILDNSTDISEWYKLSHCICPGSGPSDCLGNGLESIYA